MEAYTLQGANVLVHCRGGVGRAGLVACCWALKLGLIGWIETEPPAASPGGLSPAPSPRSELPTPPPSPADAPLSPAAAAAARAGEPRLVRRDTLRLVDRVIGVVRRRRSAKAIETYEQVLFLVDYVDYLRAEGARRASPDVANGAGRGSAGHADLEREIGDVLRGDVD